jgi:peroxiredoxin
MAKRNGTATPPQTGPKPGEPAPALRLPDLDGNTIELASFRGMDTLLLFWGLDCGYCRRMLPELRAWEASRPGSAPQLLVVSSGSAEANREMGLQSPVVLDQDFGTGRAFGARGTPSAVLVDREGRIASEVVAGDAGVMRLAAAGGSTNVANA